MEANNHHPPREILSSYSLQKLNPDEIHQLEEHLSTCAECQQVLKEYNLVSEGLLFALPPKIAPAHLRSRLAQSIAANRPAVVEPRPRFRFSLALVGLSAAVIVLLVTTIYLDLQVRYLEQQKAALTSLLDNQQASIDLITQPGINVLALNAGQIKGNLVISPDGQNGILFLRGLSTLDADHTYQVWLIPAAGAPASIGLIAVSESQPLISFAVRAPDLINNYAAIGITIEPRGGSSAPTSKPILVGNL